MDPARPSTIRIVLVDDHLMLTDALSRLLHSEPGLLVVGIAASVAELLKTRLPEFDVAVMDYLLPDGNGADAARVVKERWPAAKVIILSALIDYHATARATSAGADAYLGKEQAARELISTIRSICQGISAGPAATAQAASSRPRRTQSPIGIHHASGPSGAERLTPREMEILRALAHGRSTRQIGAELAIAPNTVRTHVQNIISKLRVHSKLEAVTLALRSRLV